MGTVILSGASDNTYGGSTTVQQGILRISKAGALGTGGADEVQTITVPATVMTFKLIFGQTTTANIVRATADGAAVQAALEPLFGAGHVTVSGGVGGPYTVTFAGDFARRNLAQSHQLCQQRHGTITHATTTDGRGVTVVNANATLEIDGGLTLDERFELNSNARGFLVESGALVRAQRRRDVDRSRHADDHQQRRCDRSRNGRYAERQRRRGPQIRARARA